MNIISIFCTEKSNIREIVRNQRMQEVSGETLSPILIGDYCVMTLILFLHSLVRIISSLIYKTTGERELSYVSE